MAINEYGDSRGLRRVPDPRNLPAKAPTEYDLLKYRQKLRKPAEVQPRKSTAVSKAIDDPALCAKYGGCQSATFEQLIADNCFAAEKCSVTGRLFAVLADLDRWWKLPGNAARAKRMSENMLAEKSAKKIAAKAEAKSAEDQLAEARAAESARVNANLARVNAEREAAAESRRLRNHEQL